MFLSSPPPHPSRLFSVTLANPPTHPHTTSRATSTLQQANNGAVGSRMLVALIFHLLFFSSSPPLSLSYHVSCQMPVLSITWWRMCLSLFVNVRLYARVCVPSVSSIFRRSAPTPEPLLHSRDGSQTSDGDGGVDECGMAESQSLARRAADEGACEARVHLNIRSEIKMCLERCQRKRSRV